MPGAGGGGGASVFNGDGGAVWEDGESAGDDGGDGRTTLGMRLMPLSRALKNRSDDGLPWWRSG